MKKERRKLWIPLLTGVFAFAFVFASVLVALPAYTTASAEETVTTKYITPAGGGTLSDTQTEGSIAVDVESDGTLVFNRIEQFNAVENDDVADATTYTIKPHGYNYNGGLIVYPAFKKQIAEYIVANSTTDGKTTINTAATLKWRVVVPSSVTQIADFAFAYKVSTDSKVYGWNCDGYNKIGTAGMVGLSFEKETTDYDLKLGAAIVGVNAIASIEIPARVTEMASTPVGLTEEEFSDYIGSITDESDIRYLKQDNSDWVFGRTKRVLTGTYTGPNADYAGTSFKHVKEHKIGTFADCYAKDVTFNKDIKIEEIPANTFAIFTYRDNTKPISVPSRTTIAIPDSVKTIGENAFLRNERLVSVDLNKVQTIKANAFNTCFKYGETETDYKNNLNGGITLTIPDTVETIESRAFYMGSGISSVTVGSGVKTVAYDAFSSSTAYPMQITEINLTEEGLKNWFSIDFGTRNCLIKSDTRSSSSTLTIPVAEIYVDGKLLTDMVIPEDVTAVNPCAFENCHCLQRVEAHPELKTIGANAFNGCTNLSTFTFPDKAAAPGSEYAVDGVDSQLTTIGASAFQNSGLMTFVIPQSVTSIGTSAFAGCTQLSEVYKLGNASYNFGSGVEVKNEYHGDTSLKIVGDFVFKVENVPVPTLIGYTGQDKAITLPESYEGEKYDIGDEAFKNNTSIIYLRIPANSVDKIGTSAFESSAALEAVVIDDGIGEIGAKAFYACAALENVTIKGPISAIKDNAFAGCSSLAYLNINDSGLQEIGATAFSGCLALTEIELPDSLVSMGEGAFYNCRNLTSVKFSASLEVIPKEAFYVYSIGLDGVEGSLGKLVIPDTVKEIGENAFGNAGLTELYIGSGVKKIGHSAFARNNGLVDVEFSENSELEYVGRVIFANTKIKRLAYPDTVKTIYNDSGSGTANWNSLRELRLPASFIVDDLYGAWNYNFSSNTSYLTVYLPEVTDANRANYGTNMLGFLVHMNANGKQYSYANFIIAPDKEAYDLVAAAINSFDSSNFSAYNKDAYLENLYALGNITYNLSGKDGNSVGTVTEQKLYSEVGTPLSYTTGKDGKATYWTKNTLAQYPDHIGGFDAKGVTWYYGDTAVTSSFALKNENYGKYEFTARLAINAIVFPFESGTISKVYDGKAWTLPEKYSNLLSFTVADGKEPINVDEYVITVSLKNADDRWSDSTTAAKTVTLTVTPAEFKIVWTMSEAWQGGYTKTYNGASIDNELRLALGLAGEITIAPEDVIIYNADNEQVDEAINAGEYRIVIKDEVLQNYSNYTFTDTEQSFAIVKRDIDISDPSKLSFGLEGYNAGLRDGWLYIYDDVPYISAQNGLGTPTIINVSKSYVRYRKDTDITVIINNIPDDAYGEGKVYTASYIDNTGKEVGTYQTTVTLSSINYNFITTNIYGGDLLARGVVIVIDADGTATVSKTWYIVQMENSLVDADGNEYEIVSGWTYGDTVDIAAPMLEYGDAQATKTAIKISLKLNGDYVAENFGVDNFAYYINSSMPAGSYELIFDVDSVMVGGDLGDILHGGFKYSFQINVAARSAADLYNDLNAALQNKTFEYKYIANRPQFLGELNAAELVKFTYGTREGFWNTDSANGYFASEAKVTFNVEGMQNYDYRTASGYSADDDYVPMNVGTYVVYYQAEVDSFMPLVANILSASSNRKSYKFTVVIYDELDIPAVIDAGLVYTGNKTLPDIAENELYEIIWNENDTYVAGGKHSVSFKIYDNVHYRWKNASGDTVSVEFTIAKADNDFTVFLSMLGWNYETFDAGLNNIRGTAQFLDEGESVHFRVVKKDETTAVEGLGDFTVDEYGKVDDSVAALLNALKVGEYTLYAKVNGTANYNELEGYISFAIGKSINTWADGEDDLVLPSWIVGMYNPEENIISVNAAHGTVNIIITDLDGNEFYKRINGVVEFDNLGDCEIGKYLLKAWVDESEDYAALAERTFTIEVFKKAGLPWWVTLLIVIGSLGVAALILWILHEKGILQMLTGKIVIAMRTKMTVDATIAAVRANKRAEESRKSVAKAEAQDRLEAARKARQEELSKSPEERAAALEEKAATEAAKAEKIQKRVERMQKQAKKLKGENEAETPVTLQEEAVDAETEETAVAEETVASEETIVAEETVAPEETAAAEETVAPEETAAAEEAVASEETAAAEDTNNTDEE